MLEKFYLNIIQQKYHFIKDNVLILIKHYDLWCSIFVLTYIFLVESLWCDLNQTYVADIVQPGWL